VDAPKTIYKKTTTSGLLHATALLLHLHFYWDILKGPIFLVNIQRNCKNNVKVV